MNSRGTSSIFKKFLFKREDRLEKQDKKNSSSTFDTMQFVSSHNYKIFFAVKMEHAVYKE